jgi:hypothetical protein
MKILIIELLQKLDNENDEQLIFLLLQKLSEVNHKESYNEKFNYVELTPTERGLAITSFKKHLNIEANRTNKRNKKIHRLSKIYANIRDLCFFLKQVGKCGGVCEFCKTNKILNKREDKILDLIKQETIINNYDGVDFPEDFIQLKHLILKINSKIYKLTKTEK